VGEYVKVWFPLWDVTAVYNQHPCCKLTGNLDVSSDGLLVKEFWVRYRNKSNDIMKMNTFATQDLSVCTKCMTQQGLGHFPGTCKRIRKLFKHLESEGHL
jgi:hypothetical protein